MKSGRLSTTAVLMSQEHRLEGKGGRRRIHVSIHVSCAVGCHLVLLTSFRDTGASFLPFALRGALLALHSPSAFNNR